MKKIIFSLFALFSLTCLVARAEEGTSKKSVKEEAVPPEVEKAVESFDQFDPQTYTCAQFTKDLPKGTDNAGVALIWVHGYQSAIYGTDEMGALDEKTIGEIAESYMEYCTKHPSESFSRASKALTKEE